MTDTDGDLLAYIAHQTAGVDLEPLPPAQGIGVRVKTTATHHIDVVAQLVNWRVCATAVDQPQDGYGFYDAGYCYYGKNLATYTRAVLGALAWDGPGHGDPAGWDKDALRGRYRADEEAGR